MRKTWPVSEGGGKPEKDVLEAKHGQCVWAGGPTAPVTAAGPEKGPRNALGLRLWGSPLTCQELLGRVVVGSRERCGGQ